MTAMNKSLLLPLIGLILLFGGLGCRCDDPTDPDCKNYDPCWDKEPVSAAFEMGVSFYQHAGKHPLQDTFMVSDTVMRGPRKVEFRGPEGYVSYRWKIGLDDREFTEQNFALFFIDADPLVEVRLIVERAPNPDCFPGDDGRDTAYQHLTVLPWDSAAIIGSYRGVLASNLQDSLEVRIGRSELFLDPAYFLFNLNPGCTPVHELVAGELGYDVFLAKAYQYTSGGCEGVAAWAFLGSSRRHITIEYRTFYPAGGDVFTGKKID